MSFCQGNKMYSHSCKPEITGRWHNSCGTFPPAVGDQGLIVLPMIMPHLTIITIDSIIVAVWLKWFDTDKKGSDDNMKVTVSVV